MFVVTKSLHYLKFLNPFATERANEILQINPTVILQRLESKNVKIGIYKFYVEALDQHSFSEAIKRSDFNNGSTKK